MDNENVELHDDGIEVVDEAQQMPVGTEEESVAATKKAASSTKQAPARKADKRGNGEKMEKAPSQREGVDFSQQLEGLMEEEATLSDSFKSKAAVIFEANFKSAVSEEVDRLEEVYSTRLDEEVQSIHEELVEKVDAYMNYVVENWMKENEVAIHQGLRTEVAENFIEGFMDLCRESYVEVPESKVDLVDGLATEVEELEGKLNEQTHVMLEMSAELEGYQREMVILESSDDLADTQIEKLRKLTEELDFEDVESFAEKVAIVKESCFNESAQSDETITEETGEDAEAVVETSDRMSHYLDWLRKTDKS